MDTNQNKSGTSIEDLELPKLPFKRLELPLRQIVGIAIPLHIQLLNQQSQNLDALAKANIGLRHEQIQAAKTVNLLKQDLYELEKVNLQVKDEDKDNFQKVITTPIREVVNALSEFMSVHSDILEPLLDVEESLPPAQLVCHLDQPSNSEEEVQLPLESKQEVKPLLVSKNWSFLKRELLEVQSLMRRFSALVFQQQDSVDSIHTNLIQTQENTQVGKEYLRKASMLKAATFPLAGAILGGLTLGPIGAIAGFKLMGCVACMAGGSAVGYRMGVKLKTKQQASSDIQMEALTYTSKGSSTSMPDLNDETETKKDR